LDFIELLENNETNEYPGDMVELMLEAWKEEAIVEKWGEGIHQIPETTLLFRDDHDRLYASDYKPTNQDILNLRTVTMSVKDTIFTINQDRIHVIDVSGLSHHRSGWISYFEDVKCVLFVASLSSYDQYMVEEEGVNRMVDSLVLFQDMVNHPLLKSKMFILFLNKKDIYEKKVATRNIVDFFPAYKGKRERHTDPRESSQHISGNHILRYQI
jgi:hypothetical protein